MLLEPLAIALLGPGHAGREGGKALNIHFFDTRSAMFPPSAEHSKMDVQLSR